MRFRQLLALGVLALGLPVSVESAPLKPIDNWDLDYGDTQCTAARSFGDPAKPINFGIVPSISGENYGLLVAVSQGGPKYAQESEGYVDFGSGPIKTWQLHYGGSGVKMSVFEYNIPAAKMESATGATMVDLRSRDGDHFSIALTDMRDVIDGLKKCNLDLRRYWGMEAAPGSNPVRGPSSLARPAKGDLRYIFSPEDYPSEAMSHMLAGTGQFTLLVDQNGAVAGCHIVKPGGAPVFDVMACDVIRQRAKFTPALNSENKPTRSVVVTPPITWRIQ